MRRIYLSPHLDDAVLSCGGLIYDQVQRGEDVEVWTFMCAVPRDASGEKYIRRMKEDRNALKLLGAKPIHYNFLDALDRRDANGEKLYTSVFVPMDPDERSVYPMSDLIKRELHTDDIVMCPLALGKHVDHVIVRSACENLGIEVTYFVDFPYVEYLPDQLEPTTQGFIKQIEPISPEGLVHWLDAVCEYVSQDLYPTQEITRKKIADYWMRDDGISLYRKE